MSNKEDLIFECPKCGDCIAIPKNAINCGVFRHGFNNDTKKVLNPHEKKEICLKLKEEGKLAGCGYPFKIVKHKGLYVLELCDWI